MLYPASIVNVLSFGLEFFLQKRKDPQGFNQHQVPGLRAFYVAYHRYIRSLKKKNRVVREPTENDHQYTYE